MSRNYKFHNPEGLYFVSFSVVKWLPVFANEHYCKLLLESLDFCQKKKGMQIFSWCIMKHHMHLVFRSANKQHPTNLLGDFKRFTSNKIVSAILANTHEKPRLFYLTEFADAAYKSSNVKHYQFWRHDNKPIELWSTPVLWQKINYIHENPVKAGIVGVPEEYLYSSAIDYAGGKGLLEDVVTVNRF